MSIKISEKFDLLDIVLIDKQSEFKKIIYNQNICFEDYYKNFGERFFSSEQYNLLLENLDLITSELFEKSAILYFEDKKEDLICFFEFFVDKIAFSYGLYKKFFKKILNILNIFLKDECFKNNYKTIELINKLYFLQKNNDKKIKEDFLFFYKKNLPLFEYIKDNNFNVVSQNKIVADNPFKLFNLIHSKFNTIYEDSLVLKGFSLNGFNKSYMVIKCRYSSFQEQKENQINRMYFFGASKELIDTLTISISEFHNQSKNNNYADIISAITMSEIEKYYTDILKKEKMYSFSEKKDVVIDDQFALVLKNYLFHANYSFFCLNLPSLSVLYIYLFLHAINLYITGKEDNNIEDGLDFLLKYSKKKSRNDKDIFLSFLTKDKFGFDLRTGILHSTGYDMPSVEIFCLYFFSFLHNNFYVNPVFEIDNEDYIKYKFNYNDLLSNMDINSHKDENNYQSFESYEDYLMKSNHQMSLFLINFVRLEEFLFRKSDNPFLCNKKNNFLILFSGFNGLRIEFMKTETYRRNKKDFDELFSLLYFEYNDRQENIRNCIFHNSMDNIFDKKYEDVLIKFNKKFKIIKENISKK